MMPSRAEASDYPCHAKPHVPTDNPLKPKSTLTDYTHKPNPSLTDRLDALGSAHAKPSFDYA